MNDFFSRQEDARRQSGLLLVLFSIAVAGVALAVYVVATLVRLWHFTPSGAAPMLWNPRLFLWTTGVTLLVIGLGSFWKIMELQEGGERIARDIGGRPVPLKPANLHEQQLRNVVEEMAIAAGAPVPDLYLQEHERGINACAAGFTPNDAVICVTRGAAELLDRDELQGVVAHEFGHIINGDMRLNLHLLGWLNGILLIGQLGEMLLRGLRRASGRGAAAVLVIGGALYAVGYIGYFCGRLIKSAVSRQREHLGDASAVQYTRNPAGLSGALKKIGGLQQGSLVDHPRAAEVSHLFFGNCLSSSWLAALDTHPPLIERIRLLEPSFNGVFPAVTPLPVPPVAEKYSKPHPVRKAPEAAAKLSGAAVLAMLDQVGTPVQEHIDEARRLIAALPGEITAATREPQESMALVYGLLMDQNAAVRARQVDLVRKTEHPEVIAHIARLAPALTELPRRARLPLLDLALPALRTIGKDEYQRLMDVTGQVITADNKLSLFEFTVQYLLRRHLEPRFVPKQGRPTQIYALRGVQKECSCVLSAIARIGQRDPEAVAAAFAKGAQVLQEPGVEIALVPVTECTSILLDRAFGVLDGASPQIKRRLLAACLESIVHDETVSIDEVELFRAIADAIGCPVPLWLGNA